ncbi:gonadoliberin III-like protein [Catenovulum agarivorans DS-2]|uniref:Gonadoliberin III-like protein n=1 Tax=Catenovulum agarivorans DS-2 TaxID=1328313 RepID=W7QLI8_9ALTE|nr:inactive transglutaminase family protein [Catenovulum agarivorans]EWH08993.1 gonadoliberin III-like protein [Catenovulum agarivorans DS-2]
MQYARWPFYALIGVLFVTGLVMSIYRHLTFQVPFLPGETLTTWSIEARVEFTADNGPVKIKLARPSSQQGYAVLSESSASSGYGVAYLDNENILEWSIRQAQGEQTLFYRVDFLHDQLQNDIESTPPAIPPVSLAEPYLTAAEQINQQLLSISADSISYAQQLFQLLTTQQNQQNLALLRDEESEPAKLAVKLLNHAGIAASVIHAVKLEDGRRRQPLVPLVKVWQSGQNSVIFDPATGKRGKPQDMLLWQQQDMPMLEVMGGFDSKVSFSIIKHQETIASAIKAQQNVQQSLVNFSIHSLPLEEQALFKTILLLPVGALIVCMLRILVGLRTSGTFMPVLIALAFIQTSLVTGLVGFTLIVFTGLLLRSYLSHLNLLLVARISAVIISVIAIITLFSLLSYQIGLSEGLKVTFFPMIILSWTIERMSVLWEEEGAKEVVIQGGGSLLTAVIAYLAMTNEFIRHLTFNFLGVQLILLAAILALGNYTGYRLFELARFKSLVERYAGKSV